MSFWKRLFGEDTEQQATAAALDFLINENLTKNTRADKEKLLAKLDNLPDETREGVASELSEAIMASLELKVAEYRRSHPTSDD